MIPNAGIAFDSDVSLFKGVGTLDRFHFVIEAEISENLRAGRVVGANFRATMKDSIGLIENDGLGDVGGNNFVVLAVMLST